MAISEARSSYVLENRASSTLREIRDDARYTTEAARRTADAIDKIGSPSQVQRLDRLGRKFGDVGRAAEGMYGRVSTATGRMESSVRRDSDRAVGHLDRLEARMEELAMRTARPRVELDGYADTRLQIMSLQHQVDQLGRSTARVRVSGGGGGILSGGRPSGGGFSGAGRTGAFMGTDGAGVFSSRAGLIGGAALAALPAVQALGGATLALSGSLAGAGLGLGAGYIAGGGALAVGIGALASIALPAKTNLQALTKAQDQHRLAVQRYQQVVNRPGVSRAQVAAAQRSLDFENAQYQRVRAQAPAGGAQFLSERHRLSVAWRDATRPGQAALLGAGAHGFAGLRQATPELSMATNQIARATGRQGTALSDYLTSPSGLLIVRDLAHTFSSNLDEAEHTAEHLIGTFGNIAHAASPFFHQGMVFLDDWTGKWERSTRDISDTRRTIGGYIDDLRTWGHLGGEAFRLIRDLTMPGQHQGNSLVDDLSHQLHDWDQWARTNPDKLQRFFHDSVDSTEKLAGFIGTIAHDLHNVANLLTPVLNRFSQLAQIAGGAGLLLPTALRYGLGKVIGGRGPTAGGGVGPASGYLPAGGYGGYGGGGASAGGGGLGSAAAVSYLAMRGPRMVTPGASSYATPEAFAQRYGGVEGARYGMPVSELGAQERRLARLPGLASAAGSKFMGAARYAAPILVVNAALTAAGTDSSGTTSDRLQNAVSGLTFGVVPQAETRQQSADKGVQQAQQVIQGMPAGTSLASLRANIARLSRKEAALIPRSEVSQGHGLFGGTGFGGLFQPGHGGDSGPTEEEARRNTASIKEYEKAIAGTERQIKSYRQELGRLHDQESRSKGFQLAGSFERGFGVLAKHDGPQSAMAQTLDDVFVKMRGMRPAGAKILGDNVLAWAREMAKKNPALADEVDKLTSKIEAKFSRMGEHVRVVNGTILTGSRTEWKSISSALIDPMQLAQQKVTDSFTAIQQQAIGSLEAMGMSPQQARSYVSGVENSRTGRQTPSSALHQGDPSSTGRARGGRVPGVGLSDTVPLGSRYKVAPGELWFANRHTEGRIDSMLSAFGTSMSREIHSETNPHGGPLRRFARGGSPDAADANRAARAGVGRFSRSNPAGGSVGGLHPGVAQAARTVLARFPGLSITSTTGGTHAAGSYHYLGEAVDIGGSPGLMDTAAGWIGAHMTRALTEGIHNPNLSVKFGQHVAPSYWGATTWAEHLNHIHLAVAGAFKGIGGAAPPGGGGSPSVRLRAPLSGLPGVPGALADRASQLYAAGLQHSLNAKIGAGGVGGLRGGKYGPNQLARLWVAAGGDPSKANLMAAIAMRESGGNPNATHLNTNGTIDRGLWQINSVWGNWSRFGGLPNAKSAVHVMATQGPTAWTTYNPATDARYLTGLSRGGLAHDSTGRDFSGIRWFGKGGDATFRRPTVIGVGDNPRGEDVTVRPRRLGPPRRGTHGIGAAGISVTIERMDVTYNAKGDIKRVVRDELRDALEELRDEFDHGVHDEAGTLG